MSKRDFMSERLAQMDRMGARLGYSHKGLYVYISTVLFAGEKYTRVECDGFTPEHFPGSISLRDAADMFCMSLQAA